MTIELDLVMTVVEDDSDLVNASTVSIALFHLAGNSHLADDNRLSVPLRVALVDKKYVWSLRWLWYSADTMSTISISLA